LLSWRRLTSVPRPNVGSARSSSCSGLTRFGAERSEHRVTLLPNEQRVVGSASKDAMLPILLSAMISIQVTHEHQRQARDSDADRGDLIRGTRLTGQCEGDDEKEAFFSPAIMRYLRDRDSLRGNCLRVLPKPAGRLITDRCFGWA